MVGEIWLCISKKIPVQDEFVAYWETISFFLFNFTGN